jgi:hypothetical protein
MAPSVWALNHLAVDMLLKFSMKGCPIKTWPKWTLEMWNVALAKGAHPWAMDPVASQQLQKESLEKAEQGFLSASPMGLHQGQSSQETQDLTYRSHPTQKLTVLDDS